jgi:hypothetical protein
MNIHKLVTHSLKSFWLLLIKQRMNLSFIKAKKLTAGGWKSLLIQTSSAKKVLISCTFEDYQKATSDELPERWLTTFNKINKV